MPVLPHACCKSGIPEGHCTRYRVLSVLARSYSEIICKKEPCRLFSSSTALYVMEQVPLPLSRLAALAWRCPAMDAADGGIKLRHGRPWSRCVADRLPPKAGRCSIACQARQAAGGQSTVVASAQLFPAHVDGGRARHPSHNWSSVAASDMTSVSAPAIASDVRCQRASASCVI